MKIPSFADIEKAAARIQPWIHRTPVLTSESLDQIAGCRLFFKCENFQKVGAFKFRGASNAVLALSDEEAQRGVATHSSGNHAAALALAAHKRGIPAWIVMPENSPSIKKKAVAGYGGQITFCPPTQQDRERTLAQIVDQHQATFIHPYDHPDVIAGQGTAAMELLAQVPDLDLLITPVGGGGLLSGSAIAAKAIRPNIRIWGAEPALADDAARSFHSGQRQPALPPRSICDGLLTSLSERTFSILRTQVDDIRTASEKTIITAMRHIWERMKIIVESSCAVPLATLLEHGPPMPNARIGVILTGGNVDLDKLPWTDTTTQI